MAMPSVFTRSPKLRGDLRSVFMALWKNFVLGQCLDQIRGYVQRRLTVCFCYAFPSVLISVCAVVFRSMRFLALS